MCCLNGEWLKFLFFYLFESFFVLIWYILKYLLNEINVFSYSCIWYLFYESCFVYVSKYIL